MTLPMALGTRRRSSLEIFEGSVEKSDSDDSTLAFDPHERDRGRKPSGKGAKKQKDTQVLTNSDDARLRFPTLKGKQGEHVR